MQTLIDVVSADFKKNHQGRSYDCAFVHENFEKYVNLGLLYFRTERVIIIYNIVDGQVEFHCMNGGNGADLTSAINEFLSKIALKYQRAVTYYDNPRINELVKYSKYPAEVVRIDRGEDKTFEMSFDLRGE